MTDAQILRAHNMRKLLFGPYRAPTTRHGQELQCAIHGLCVVAGEHGPMQWPRAQCGGHPRLIVCGDLKRALQEETAEAIAMHWGLSVAAVSRYRGMLQLPPISRAGSMIKAAQMRAKRTVRPDLHVDPGTAAVTALSSKQRHSHGKVSAGEKAWTEVEIEQLRNHANAEVSLRTGRTIAAVRTARSRTNVPAPSCIYTCRHCRFQWKSSAGKPPRKCSNPACRRLNWS